MEKAILHYAAIAQNNLKFCQDEDLENMNPGIRENCKKGMYFTRRNTLTDFTVFEDTFGYKLPQDIGDLINLFWHPYIYGYYKLHECIILFSCHNRKTEADDDIMCQKNGIVDLGKRWRDNYGGDITQYLPIGWTSFSGGYILYELSTGRIFEEDIDNVGIPANEPFAGSLKELIRGLSLKTV